MPVRILVVDDHEVVRQGIRTILSARPEWEICGEAVNGQEAIKLAEELRPDAIIMDITMRTRRPPTLSELKDPEPKLGYANGKNRWGMWLELHRVKGSNSTLFCPKNVTFVLAPSTRNPSNLMDIIGLISMSAVTIW